MVKCFMCGTNEGIIKVPISEEEGDLPEQVEVCEGCYEAITELREESMEAI